MGFNNHYKDTEYIKKQRESHLGEKNPNWKGGITKPFVKGCGKTGMLQDEYLKSKNNPFIKYKWRFGTKNKGKKRNKMQRRNISKAQKMKYRIGFIHPMKGKQNPYLASINSDPTNPINIRRINTIREKHKDPEFLKKKFAWLKRKPTKPEKILRDLFIKHNLSYKYVGDGQIWMGYPPINPDFINYNGQKKIIEMYGDYWHNREDIKKRDKIRMETYSKYGFQSLVIWESELKDLNTVLNKIKKFDGGI